MGSVIFNNAKVMLSTTTCSGITTTGMYDISAIVSRVRLNMEAAEVDDTVMGMEYRSRLPGLKSWQVDLELLQDFAAAVATPFPVENPDKVLFAIYDDNPRVIISVRPDNAIRSSCNPDYYGPARLFGYSPLDGAVGDLLKVNPSFRSAGNIIRSVTSS